MKKLFILFAILMIAAVSLFAQAPQKFSFQAVLRDAGNNLVTNHAVGVRISILQGGMNGSIVYMESQTVVTNANGLMTLQIGGGTVLNGNMSNIDWANGPFFIKTEADPDGGSNYTIEGVQQLLSVPYALFAGNSTNSFSGDYNDLINTPDIPTVPTNVSAFNNDAQYITQAALGSTLQNYITMAQIPAQVNADWNATSGAAEIYNKPALFSGNYNDLTNLPTLFDGNYNSLYNKPTLFSGNYNDLTNKPTLFDGNYYSLSNRPNLATVATTGNYNDLTNRPQIPTVPTNVSVFNNDAQYITAAQLNTLLAAMNSTIDSLRDRIEELEANPVPTVDTTVNGQACPGMTTVTDQTGNVYPTVQIGNQCWMRENLRTTKYADGTDIANGTTSGVSSSTTTAYYYPLQGDYIYGYLYNWKAVMRNSSSSQANPSGVQGVCPNGWHVPSDAEWEELKNYVSTQLQYLCNSNNNYLAKALASKTGWGNTTATCAVGNVQENNNATGFSVLPSGFYYGGSYSNYGSAAFFWSATEGSNDYTFDRSLTYNNAELTRSNHQKGYGFSVRCLRDGGSTTTLPTVTTMLVTSITATTANTGGNVTDDGGSAVTARGVCWSTSHNPTTDDNYTTDGQGMGSFTSSLTGLTSGTTYYVRAYATNAHGTAYGSEVSFTTQIPFICGTSTVSDFEGHSYNTVQIGEQCWMKENMRATKYADGTEITLAGSGEHSQTTPYYYNVGHATAYGYLYNWAAAKGPASVSANNQGICPTGWHVPSQGEWTQLTQYVSSQPQYLCNDNIDNIAKALAATTGWNSSSAMCAVGNTPASNDATGFSALPAGYTNGSGNCYATGDDAEFWSPMSYNADRAYMFRLGSVLTTVSSQETQYKQFGISVRCLRD